MEVPHACVRRVPDLSIQGTVIFTCDLTPDLLSCIQFCFFSFTGIETSVIGFLVQTSGSMGSTEEITQGKIVDL